MIACRVCGWENDEGAPSCAGCGAPRSGPPPPGPLPPGPLPPGPLPPGPPPPGPQADPGQGVPRRSIPVRIAPTATRPLPGPVVSGPGGGAAAPDAFSTFPGMPAAGETTCRDCRRSVPVGRRFCACGAVLVRDAPDRTDPVPRPSTWWGEWAGHRDLRRSMRVAGGGRMPPYDTAISARVLGVRVVLVLLLLGAVGSQLGPWGTEFRRLVVERVEVLRSGG